MLWIGRGLRRGSRGILAFAALQAFGFGAHAVVHTTGDGSGNTHASPPPDDPGIDNVGKAGGQTGVYLGDGWVITADHVGEQDIDLLGVTYSAIPGSFRQFEHDLTDFADLGVYRISGSPPLPSPIIAATPPSVGEEVVAAGRGWTREPSLTAWNASWVEVPQPGTHRGYKRATGAVVRWGRNEIDAVDMDFSVSGRVTRAFLLSFDELGLPDEMQVVAKDSGGGVYVKRGADWELVGIQFLLLIPLPLDGQPANTAVFGDLSGVVDVSFYHDQIIATINPQIPGLPGPYLFWLAALLLAAARPGLRR